MICNLTVIPISPNRSRGLANSPRNRLYSGIPSLLTIQSDIVDKVEYVSCSMMSKETVAMCFLHFKSCLWFPSYMLGENVEPWLTM